jgi:mono/diheme cytochrome c family protein
LNGRNITFIAVALIMVGVVAINIFAGRRPSTTTINRMDARNTELVAQGQRIYVAQCASCHGANLEGQASWQERRADGSMPAPPHDESGHTWHHSDALLFEIVKNGGQASSPPGYKNGMPAFGGTLSDTEIWAVLSYIKSTWSTQMQTAQEQGRS